MAANTLYERSSTQPYGFTALPAADSKTPPATDKPRAIAISELQTPVSALARRIDSYVQTKLSKDTYNHSLRVYAYGLAVARQCYPDWELLPGSKLEETW
jgi:cyanamide hydratase